MLYDLMASRPEVIRSIVKVLVERIRSQID
jgi:hypothetical protein